MPEPEYALGHHVYWLKIDSDHAEENQQLQTIEAGSEFVPRLVGSSHHFVDIRLLKRLGACRHSLTQLGSPPPKVASNAGLVIIPFVGQISRWTHGRGCESMRATSGTSVQHPTWHQPGYPAPSLVGFLSACTFLTCYSMKGDDLRFSDRHKRQPPRAER